MKELQLYSIFPKTPTVSLQLRMQRSTNHFLQCRLRASDVFFPAAVSDVQVFSALGALGSSAIQDHLNGSIPFRLRPPLSLWPILLPPPRPPPLPSLLVCFQSKATGAGGCARKPAACRGFQPLLKPPLGCQGANGCFTSECALRAGSENAASSRVMFNFQQRNPEPRPSLDLPQSHGIWMNTGVTSECERNQLAPEPLSIQSKTHSELCGDKPQGQGALRNRSASSRRFGELLLLNTGRHTTPPSVPNFPHGSHAPGSPAPGPEPGHAPALPHCGSFVGNSLLVYLAATLPPGPISSFLSITASFQPRQRRQG